MTTDPLDALLADLCNQLAAYVAVAKSVPGDDELLDAAEAVRDASAALSEGIAERTGHLISLHYVLEDDEDDDVSEPIGPGIHVVVEERLRIVHHEKLLQATGSPTPHDAPGESAAERAVGALLDSGLSLHDLVANADRYGLDPVDGATHVELIDFGG